MPIARSSGSRKLMKMRQIPAGEGRVAGVGELAERALGMNEEVAPRRRIEGFRPTGWKLHADDQPFRLRLRSHETSIWPLTAAVTTA